MIHQVVPTALGFVETVFWFFLGILISIFFPVIIKTVRRNTGLESKVAEPTLSFGKRIQTAWDQYGGNRYLKLLVATVLVAVVLVFVLGLKFYTARDAALAGIGWESLSNKLFVQQKEQNG